MITNTMIDLETMSTRGNAAIASIAAVPFDPEKISTYDELLSGPIFYEKVDLNWQEDRHFEANTIYWWLTQSEAARKGLINNVQPLPSVLHQLRIWFEERKGEHHTWAYGGNFDHGVLRSAFIARDIIHPVGYQHEFCMRTAVRLARVKRPEIPEIIQHNALDDAIIQIIWLQTSLMKLRENGNQK